MWELHTNKLQMYSQGQTNLIQCFPFSDPSLLWFLQLIDLRKGVDQPPKIL